MKQKITSMLLCGILCFSALNAQTSSFETPARGWIKENTRNLGIPGFSTLKLSSVRKGNTGETLRFQQMIKDVPVFQSEVLVHFNKEGKISYTSSESLKKNVQEVSTVPAVAASEALQKAHKVSKTAGEVISEENKLFVYVTDENITKLVYRVVINSHDHSGTWETIVDAQTGDPISVKDISLRHKGDHEGEDPKKNKKPAAKKVQGSAYIYNPDPLTAAGVAYGGQYVDGNDATNASLDAARTLVNIPELELAAGVYKLKGTYAEIRNLEAPVTGLFTQATDQFLFNRNDQGFEAVNVYWHLDNSLRYINEVLNIDCIPYQNNGILLFDPHGWNGQDQSSYNYAGGLRFGEGCVDDGEDADVILHELGHGIHDWMTNGSPSGNLLGEGVGDYWAQSYARSLNLLQPTAASYNYIFKWDGHNPCWGGRSTNYSGIYPTNLTGSGHTDGQILSSALMRIHEVIGREKTDRSFLEGLALTTSNTNQQQAAIAIRQAAIDMLGTFGFNCNDIAVMTQKFTAAGYVLPEYNCALSTKEVNKENQASVYPNPATDALFVVLKGNKEEKAEIHNMEGRKIMETTIGNGKNKIDISNLPSGNYILTVKGIDLSSKFIKK